MFIQMFSTATKSIISLSLPTVDHYNINSA